MPRLRNRWSIIAAAILMVSCNGPTEPLSRCDGVARNRVAAFPNGWGGGAPTGYMLGTDNLCRHGGARAGFLASTVVQPNGFTAFTQSIRADEFRGKRVRWRGWVRSQDVASYAGLWMRVDGAGEMLAFDNSYFHPIKGTADWHEVEVVLDVRETALGIAFGILLSGAGDVVIDDLSMDVVPLSHPSTDQLLVPEPTSTPAATTIAFYATRPARGANLDFEGGGTAAAAFALERHPAPASPLGHLRAPPAR